MEHVLYAKINRYSGNCLRNQCETEWNSGFRWEWSQVALYRLDFLSCGQRLKGFGTRMKVTAVLRLISFTKFNAHFLYSVTISYIIILDKFRAPTCPSSGGQIVLSQHLLSSLSVNGCTESDDTRCCDNTICPPEDGHVDARNMTRIVM
jgi:hypothetical protein